MCSFFNSQNSTVFVGENERWDKIRMSREVNTLQLVNIYEDEKWDGYGLDYGDDESCFLISSNYYIFSEPNKNW